ncbi:conserved hypothetical protein [Burkholderia cenocepacia]|nr:conserved hypothetical protein [Burkholderia cenocepacia]
MRRESDLVHVDRTGPPRVGVGRRARPDRRRVAAVEGRARVPVRAGRAARPGRARRRGRRPAADARRHRRGHRDARLRARSPMERARVERAGRRALFRLARRRARPQPAALHVHVAGRTHADRRLGHPRAAARGRIPCRCDPPPDRRADARADRRADHRQRRVRTVLGVAGRVRARRRPARIRPSGRWPSRVPADHAEAHAPRGPEARRAGARLSAPAPAPAAVGRPANVRIAGFPRRLTAAQLPFEESP